MPYHRWSLWFDGMEKELQLRLLRWAHAHWVSSQARYHDKRAKEHTHNRHALHKLSGALALCGVLLIIALVWNARYSFLETFRFKEIAEMAAPFGWLLGIALTLLFLGFWLFKGLQSACRAWMNFVVPTFRPPLYQSRHAKHLRMIGAFLAHLPFALLLGAGILAYSVRGRGESAAFLNAEALIEMASAILLLLGALLVGWTEKNLLSEQAYQYNAMASLYNAAQSRLDTYVKEAEKAHKENDAVTRDARIRQARQMLYDLGIEALDENAEWLILHRARPMEPIMAG
jgi:hypothetical protein